MDLVSVAAVADNGVIGCDGGLPWPAVPADRRQYRARVAGHPTVLGRRTFDSMRDDPPGSTQVVLSRRAREASVGTAQYVTGVDEALEAVEAVAAERAYVLGGAEIYELFQPVVSGMVLSRIPGEYPGDAHFPDWDRDAWTCRERVADDGFTLERWVRTD